MDLKTTFVEAYVRSHKTFSFRKLLEKQNSKMEVIVTFLVILEMIKTGRISVEQEDTFSDIIELAGLCKFRNCRHQSEPGCAVKKAVEDGTISAKRLKLFMNLQEENTGKK